MRLITLLHVHMKHITNVHFFMFLSFIVNNRNVSHVSLQFLSLFPTDHTLSLFFLRVATAIRNRFIPAIILLMWTLAY